MKVLHIIIALDPPGGAERMLVRLALEQRRLFGVEPSVACLTAAGPLGRELREKEVPVFPMGLHGAISIVPTIRRLVRLIRETRPDVVQTWMYHADLLGGIAARIAGCRNIVWGIRNTDLFHGQGVSRSLRQVVRLCAWFSNVIPRAIVAVAEAARLSHERLGYAPPSMIVIPNGFVEVPRASARDRAAARRELGMKDDVLLVGSVGRYNEYKDQQLFVRAMARVAAEVPNAMFLMVGRGNVPANRALRDAIEATEHADRFRLIGESDRIWSCYAAMDLFCLHSKSEGFPNVLAEAMLAGIPAISTDVGDARVLAGETVDFVAPGDEAALASAAIRALREPIGERRERTMAARRHVMENFGMPAIAGLYFALYRTIASGEAGLPRSRTAAR